MIPSHVLRSIEKKCNEVVCPECGGRHEIYLRDEKGSGVIRHSFSADACESFQGAALSLLRSEITSFMVNPIPLIG